MWKFFGVAVTSGMVVLAWPTSDPKADAYGCKESAKYRHVAEYCKNSDALDVTAPPS